MVKHTGICLFKSATPFFPVCKSTNIHGNRPETTLTVSQTAVSQSDQMIVRWSDDTRTEFWPLQTFSLLYAPGKLMRLWLCFHTRAEVFIKSLLTLIYTHKVTVPLCVCVSVIIFFYYFNIILLLYYSFFYYVILFLLYLFFNILLLPPAAWDVLPQVMTESDILKYDSRTGGTTRLQNPLLSGVKNKVMTSKSVIRIKMLAMKSKLMASNMCTMAWWPVCVCACADVKSRYSVDQMIDCIMFCFPWFYSACSTKKVTSRNTHNSLKPV